MPFPSLMSSSLFLVGTEAAQIFKGSPGASNLVRQVKALAAEPVT